MVIDIWRSFRALPLWVQIWVAGILVPVNLASVLFWPSPYGLLVTLLAIGGMIPNLLIMVWERGLSKMMALPHLLIWIPLVMFLTFILATNQISGDFRTYVIVLLVVDLMALVFDIPDMIKWTRGDRAVAGK